MVMLPIAYPKVKVVTTANAVSGAPTKQQKTVSVHPPALRTAAKAAPSASISLAPPVAQAQTVAPAARVRLTASEYTNSLRERDRYMIQWFDYKCKNCGVVWKADCVTISYRQTAVSQSRNMA